MEMGRYGVDIVGEKEHNDRECWAGMGLRPALRGGMEWELKMWPVKTSIAETSPVAVAIVTIYRVTICWC